MPESERTVELHKAIESHLATNGPRGWARVRDAFPDISAATFWRHVRSVRDRREADEGRHPPDGADGRGTSSAPEYAKQAGGKSDKPRHGSLAYYYSELRHAARYQRLMEDAEKVAEQCIDRKGRITRPAVYLRAIATRQRLLEYEDAAMDNFVSKEAYFEFMDSIFNVLGQLSEVTRQIGVEMLREVIGRIEEKYPEYRTDGPLAKP